MARLPLDRIDPLDVGGVHRGELGRPLLADIARGGFPGSGRRAPYPRRPEPRSRTRCDSGSRAPRWRPFAVLSIAGSSLPCRMPGKRPANRRQQRKTSMDWTADLVTLAQVIMIDIALAGDNAVVVGMAVAGLPPQAEAPGDPGWASARRRLIRIAHGRRGAAASGDHRPAARRRAAAALGLLAHVSRAAPPASDPGTPDQDACAKRCSRSCWPTCP